MDESLLQGLLRLVRESPIGMGMRSTLDAAQQDVDSISRGGMPQQLMRAGEQAMGAYNNPIGGVVLPRIPKFAEGATRISNLDDVLNAMDVVSGRKAAPVFPTGQFDTMLGTMLESPALGGIGQKINSLRKIAIELGERSAGKKSVGAKVFKRDPIADELIAMAGGSAKPAARTVGSKTFTDALPARLARPGSSPETPLEKMLAAVIDEKTGQVIHAKTPYRAGDHGGLETLAATIQGFKPTRGFVDPATLDAFTEAMLEEALMRSKGFLR